MKIFEKKQCQNNLAFNLMNNNNVIYIMIIFVAIIIVYFLFKDHKTGIAYPLLPDYNTDPYLVNLLENAKHDAHQVYNQCMTNCTDRSQGIDPQTCQTLCGTAVANSCKQGQQQCELILPKCIDACQAEGYSMDQCQGYCNNVIGDICNKFDELCQEGLPK